MGEPRDADDEAVADALLRDEPASVAPSARAGRAASRRDIDGGVRRMMEV
jgi:hypothetical protein